VMPNGRGGRTVGHKTRTALEGFRSQPIRGEKSNVSYAYEEFNIRPCQLGLYVISCRVLTNKRRASNSGERELANK
jgi:hypothetical protein